MSYRRLEVCCEIWCWCAISHCTAPYAYYLPPVYAHKSTLTEAEAASALEAITKFVALQKEEQDRILQQRRAEEGQLQRRLDTLRWGGEGADVTFNLPYPQRWAALLSNGAGLPLHA